MIWAMSNENCKPWLMFDVWKGIMLTDAYWGSLWDLLFFLHFIKQNQWNLRHKHRGSCEFTPQQTHFSFASWLWKFDANGRALLPETVAFIPVEMGLFDDRKMTKFSWENPPNHPGYTTGIIINGVTWAHYKWLKTNGCLMDPTYRSYFIPFITIVGAHLVSSGRFVHITMKSHETSMNLWGILTIEWAELVFFF